ncbi:hypothetical protein KBY93_02340 [Synechococcus sp. J7-Johnson]|uniref:hypothetical protein n=1 Tax=Synechococcus sp. J7-Johnson TaxID=2823737 RepID=UPI0020CBA567|nr:hypothetical protein [Synechococcus sp. J7-Johnson]MCP9839472.1 hypothetical protein [Synechococcus sp. J7-Johnson]
MTLLRYFANLRPGKQVLWCYLIWYLVSAIALFEPDLLLWLNSLGLSLIIGVGLMLSVSRAVRAPSDHWTTLRLFLMPFCVSSFAALTKGKGYVLLIPGRGEVLTVSLVACGAFLLACRLLRGQRRLRNDSQTPATDRTGTDPL